MRVSVSRKSVRFVPDSSRVIARYFMNGDDRTRNMITRVMAMNDIQVSFVLEQTLRDFASRHRNITRVFLRHCANIQHIIEGMELD